MENIIIRGVRTGDAAALLAIYAPYVEKTAITFEYEVPTVEEFTARIEQISVRYPYLVAEREDGTILGYSYASAFRSRPAYQWAVETTIYLAENARGQGIGRALYAALEKELQAQNALNAYACIAYPCGADEHLTDASVCFHEAMGYRMAGRFRQCGYKFGAWYDMVYMEKMLGEHKEPKPITNWNRIE
ncbi:MAG: N-acetyltransferase [Lachnospiraceae bacterium]|nr:N-acetyltransferase [Lachnospiraceae bacterium]